MLSLILCDTLPKEFRITSLTFISSSSFPLHVLTQRMEFEEALCLYKKILDSYRSHINQCKLVDRDEAEYEPHVGTTLHNIGIVYLLNQRYDLACESLQKATAARASCLGERHMDYIVSCVDEDLSFRYSQHIWRLNHCTQSKTSHLFYF